MTSKGFRVAFGRDYRIDTLHINGKTEQHVENCRCTVKVTHWPCGQIEEAQS